MLLRFSQVPLFLAVEQPMRIGRDHGVERLQAAYEKVMAKKAKG
jgi:hypothetical protein